MIEPGLHVIFDSVKDGPGHCAADIDIVAVHGLNFRNNPDHARDTWKAADSLWLRDFLPARLSKPVRVILFSYNSSPAIDATTINIDDHAKNLLHLGGLVVKEALVEATLDPTYKPIVEATRLLVFFATPHRGGKYANIGDIAAKIVRASLQKPSNKLLDALKKQSDSATKRFEQSRHLYERCLIVNFFEGQPYGKLGIGKSEVCLKVADELREKVFHYRKDVGSKEAEIDGTRRLLSNIDAKRYWLLILDNADNPEVNYQEYCPSGIRGAVLITSRNPECRLYETVGYEELGSLEKGDCIRLLLQPTGLSSEPQAINSAAEKVIDILGSHTLAILQAGSYIAQGGCSLSNYPVVFQKQRERLLKFNLTQAQSRYRNVYATMEASAQTLDTLESESAEDALCLLQILSQFHYENVPLDLLQDAWNGAQEARDNPEDDEDIGHLTSWHVSHLPEFLESDSHVWDPFRTSAALNRLESLALVKRGNIKGRWTVSMHSLAHTWINIRQSQIQRDESLRTGQAEGN
ncbi:hypothetical protein DL764_004088 [Monosporascus ibericus]|uniref:NB-ARC domain-containing protein n=1 Tax=Monosporascus ibericus TaxID=155417 RepID=A0A4Q4TIE3_9PEZI|nr:hypothetical protein DL764_004088 [Monosporascus ibericus]